MPALREYEHGRVHRWISVKEWKKFVDILYGKMNLHEWKKKYIIPDVLDGTQWELKVLLSFDETIVQLTAWFLQRCRSEL